MKRELAPVETLKSERLLLEKNFSSCEFHPRMEMRLFSSWLKTFLYPIPKTEAVCAVMLDFMHEFFATYREENDILAQKEPPKTLLDLEESLKQEFPTLSLREMFSSLQHLLRLKHLFQEIQVKHLLTQRDRYVGKDTLTRIRQAIGEYLLKKSEEEKFLILEALWSTSLIRYHFGNEEFSDIDQECAVLLRNEYTVTESGTALTKKYFARRFSCKEEEVIEFNAFNIGHTLIPDSQIKVIYYSRSKHNPAFSELETRDVMTFQNNLLSRLESESTIAFFGSVEVMPSGNTGNADMYINTLRNHQFFCSKLDLRNTIPNIHLAQGGEISISGNIPGSNQERIFSGKITHLILDRSTQWQNITIMPGAKHVTINASSADIHLPNFLPELTLKDTVNGENIFPPKSIGKLVLSERTENLFPGSVQPSIQHLVLEKTNFIPKNIANISAFDGELPKEGLPRGITTLILPAQQSQKTTYPEHVITFGIRCSQTRIPKTPIPQTCRALLIFPKVTSNDVTRQDLEKFFKDFSTLSIPRNVERIIFKNPRYQEYYTEVFTGKNSPKDRHERKEF